MSGWVWLVNPAINGIHRVPDNPEVIASFTGRDWIPTDVPGELDPDDEQFHFALADWADRQQPEPESQPEPEAPKAKPATKNKEEVDNG